MPERAAKTTLTVDSRALRDGAALAIALGVATWAGSRGGRDLDPALFGYLGAVFVAAIALAARASAFWRRPASAFYARALVSALRDPKRLRTALSSATVDVAAQRFVAERSRVRWLGHLALSLGTLASFAITLPLVFGWLHFEAEGQETFRPIVAGLPMPAMALDSVLAWVTFHALTIAGVAVLVGTLLLLGSRLRRRGAAGALSASHLAPLLLLLFVAATGLALPASRAHPSAFALASRLHELSVVTLLVGLSCSKLGHVLVRPLQIGARIVKAAGVRVVACDSCGAAFAPAAQLDAVKSMLARRGGSFTGHQDHCPRCRRRMLGATQAMLVGARFHPELVEARPRRTRRAA